MYLHSDSLRHPDDQSDRGQRLATEPHRVHAGRQRVAIDDEPMFAGRQEALVQRIDVPAQYIV